MTKFLLITLLTALIVSLFSEIKKRRSDSIPLTVWKYLSYYTILSNLLVFVWFAVQVFWPDSQTGKLAFNANVAAAITFYISTVGMANYMIYGWQELSFLNRIADLLVHAITPLFTFLFWLSYANKEGLEYSLLGYWLIYPLCYAFYTIIHGKWTRFYPYNFTNIQELGVKRVSINGLGLTVCLMIGGALFILLGKSIG